MGLWRWMAAAVCLVGACGGAGVRAQQADEGKLREELVGRPMYLRGFWMGQALEFDGEGKLVGKAQQGQLTLSGVDVKSVAVRGDQMQVRAVRMALVADAEGKLQRRGMFSTTLMPFTYQKKFEAREEVKITFHASSEGSFEPALKMVFAEGLKELAAVAPAYWSCYAKVYLRQEKPQADAEKVVEACSRRLGVGMDGATDGVTEPRLVGELHGLGTRQAAELGVSGESRIHFTVGPHGVPLRFQVVKAVGAGLDETVMQAIAMSRFTPAMKDGAAVAADMEMTVEFSDKEK